MGNQQTYSSHTSSSRTHYTVHCHKHTWINVYDGYDSGLYDHYRNTSGNCPLCAEEENERQRKLAQKKAQRAKEKEEQRIKALQARLEQEERDRQEQARLDRIAKRKAESDRLKLERQNEEKKRLKIQQDLIRESEEKIKKEIDRLKSIKTTNPYIAWKKCDTINVVKEIGNQALQCAMTGQIVLERVDNIKGELKESLKHDYKTVEPEIARYKKYGNEMKSMTNAFIQEFGSVFQASKGIKTEFKVFADDLNEALQNHDQEDEKFAKQEIEQNINALSTAINKMKLKLLLMDQYYGKMQKDYQFFIEYINNRSDEFSNQKTDIVSYLDGTAKGMKKERDVFQGTELKEDEKPKESVEEKYDTINVSELKKHVVIGTKTFNEKGNYASEGAAIGIGVGVIAGGIVGGIATAPACGVGIIPGMVVGGIVGGLLGACVGSLIKKKGKFTREIMGTEKRMVATKVKNGGSVKLDVDRDHYDGVEHARALRTIGDSMKKPIDDFLNEMKNAKQTAQQQQERFKNLQSDVTKMLKNVNEFASNVRDMKQILSKPNGISDERRKQLDKKWKQTSAKISGMLQSMKQTNNNQ